MEPFEVRRYRPGDEEEILALFNRVVQADDSDYVPRTMATWRHRYIDNPMGYQVLVATDAAGEIIGNYSAMAMHCSVRGEKRRCAQAVDTVVDRAWRGSLRKSSVFVTIGRQYLEEFCRPEGDTGNEYAYGLPNNQAFGVGTRILGYKPVHCPMPTQVKEIDEAWVEELEKRTGSVTVTEDDWSSLEEVEQLFLRNLDQVPLGLWRDATYLAWRYRDWPDVRYRLLLARRDGDVVGALVFCLGWFGQPIVPLMDWIGPGDDRESLSALVAQVGRITLAEGGSRLETWVTPNMPQLRTLQAMGFGAEESPFNLCIMVYGRDFDLDWSAANWFFTMGDSDIY
jgi:hypothetical protein